MSDNVTHSPIEEVELSDEEIRAEQQRLAASMGLSVEAAYDVIDREEGGDFRGTIVVSQLHMLRFLLGEDAQPIAAE